MFVRSGRLASATALTSVLLRPCSFHSRSLSLLSSAGHCDFDRVTNANSNALPQPLRSATLQAGGSWSMPWASALGCSVNIPAANSQLRNLRKTLTSSQRFARQAVPYVGCLTIASAGGLHFRGQQPDRQRRHQPLSSKASVAEASAFSSMQQTDDDGPASSSDSDSPESVQGRRPNDNGAANGYGYFEPIAAHLHG